MKNISKSDIKSQHHNIVLWSEGKQYWTVFAPVVAYLQEQKIPFTYLASSDEDAGLEICENSSFIGLNKASFRLLNKLKANMVVMTTPGLGDLSVKRSKNVAHYSHIVHAPTDIHTYNRVAFECFDSILCSGDFQIDTIRKLESIRGTEAKDLHKVGCTYFDAIVPHCKPEMTDNKTVLLAPTWGVNSALLKSEALLPPLLEKGYKVIIRPHPQSLRSEKTLVDSIKEKYASNDNIQWDTNPSGVESFNKACVMISDLSGVIFDFAFAYKKPVVCFDAPLDMSKMEGAELSDCPWEINIRPQLGALITHDTIGTLSNTVAQLIGKKIPDTLIHNSIYNFGNAGETAGKTLVKILNSIEKAG